MKHEILLIDDDLTSRDKILKLIPDHFNSKIIIPKNFKELSKLIQKKNHNFDAAVIDINLSQWKSDSDNTTNDSFDIIESIKKKNKDIPIAVFSNFLKESDYKSRIKLLNIGENDFIIEKELFDSIEIDNEQNALVDFLEHTLSSPKEVFKQDQDSNENEIIKLNNGIEIIRNEIQIINRSLIHELKDKPYNIYNLTPKEFEELIAELYRREGYHVELTPQTRDGGVDIYAYKEDDLHNILLAIECKRYSNSRKVGRPDIMKLHSRVEYDRLTAGVLATSSYFTNDATVFTKALKNRIFLKDFYDIKKLIEKHGH